MQIDTSEKVLHKSFCGSFTNGAGQNKGMLCLEHTVDFPGDAWCLLTIKSDIKFCCLTSIIEF